MISVLPGQDYLKDGDKLDSVFSDRLEPSEAKVKSR